ncbi:MAG: hypothetical protein ACRCV5_07800 [Afipia sp.]
MAKQSNGLSSLASAIAGAFATVETTGGLVATICASVQKLYKGAEMPSDDVAYVCDEVARLRGWSDASARVRKAECKAILGQYATLPEAIEKASTKKHVSFDAAVKLARSLKSMTPRQAAAAYIAGKSATRASDPTTRTLDEAKASIKKHVNRVLEFTQVDRKFRAELRSLCEEYGIAL